MLTNALRHYVDVLEPNEARDPDTNQVLPGANKVVMKALPVSLETVAGSEVKRGRQMQATTSVLLTAHSLRGQFAITPDHRLRVLGEQRNGADRIIHVNAAYDPDGRNVELHIEGREDQ